MSTFETIKQVDAILKSRPLLLTSEKELQKEIEELFTKGGLKFEREYFFDKNNIVDFFIDGVAIEVKIKGSKKEIYRQCERYCQFDDTKALLLVTSKAMGFPVQINGKDCYYYSLSKNWL